MLAFVLLLLVFSPIAIADERLIEVQCHNALVPLTCIKCVTSDPGGLQADKFGIAAILLNCMQNHTTNLNNQMKELASSSQDEKMKLVAANCAGDYLLAGQQLVEAGQELKGGDYDKTNAYIVEAVENQYNCNDDETRYKLKFPAATEDEMGTYVELSNAALRIIDRF